MIEIEGQLFTFDQLPEKLAALHASNPGRFLYIGPVGSSASPEIKRIIDACNKAQFMNLVFVKSAEPDQK